MTYISDRITIDAEVCGGRPTIRGMRITVQTILEFLFAGDSREEVLKQFPMLEEEDLNACQRFAIELMDRNYIIKNVPDRGKISD